MHLLLLIAQVDHGSGAGMGVVHLAFVAAVIVGGLAFVVVRAARRGSARHTPSVSDRDPERDGRQNP